MRNRNIRLRGICRKYQLTINIRQEAAFVTGPLFGEFIIVIVIAFSNQKWHRTPPIIKAEGDNNGVTASIKWPKSFLTKGRIVMACLTSSHVRFTA